MIQRSSAGFVLVCAPNSKPKYLITSGGWLGHLCQSQDSKIVHTGRWSTQGLCNAAQVHNNSLDSVAFALNLRLETLHFVTIKGIRNILEQKLGQTATDYRMTVMITRRILRVAMMMVELC